jgi:hypothetical protein
VSRRLLFVLALGGCDRAFGLERDLPPPVCGPFGPPEEVVFDGALGAVSDFSVDASGTYGMVYANIGNTNVTPWRGPHAIVKSPSGMWIQDTARDKPVLNSLDGAHIIGAGGSAISWLDSPRGPMSGLLSFAGGAWSTVVGDILDRESDKDAHFGNVIDLPVGQGLIQRFAVELRLSFDRNEPGELRILQRIPTDSNWMPTEQATPLNTANPPLDLDGGVMTADHEILVYTARVGEEKHSRAFASRRIRDQYNPGVELIIDGVDNDASITEPWINADCTQLYYREGDTTWVTTALP